MLGRWASRYLNAATLAIHCGLLLAAVFTVQNSDRHALWFVFALVSMVASFVAWLFNLRRLLAISEYPTSTIAAATQGYVELTGGARQILPLKSPLQGRDCVWFRYWVYACDENGLWHLEKYQSSEQPFEIEDATGRCRVDPNGAEIIAAERHQKRQHDHRYIEELIPIGKSTYVLGHLRTITEATAAQQIKQETGQLLARWKRAPEHFLRRFDLDGNGEVDMDEWEQARAHARLEVLREKGVQNGNEIHLIHAAKDGRLFLISGVSPLELRSRYKFWGMLHLMFFLAAMLLAYSQGRGVL